MKPPIPPTPQKLGDLDELVEDSQEEGRQDQAKDFPPVPNAVTTTRSKRKRPREKNQPPHAREN
jgi:hypothetical protein